MEQYSVTNKVDNTVSLTTWNNKVSLTKWNNTVSLTKWNNKVSLTKWNNTVSQNGTIQCHKVKQFSVTNKVEQ